MKQWQHVMFVVCWQTSFRQVDGAQPTRETFLKALASIDTFLIRSTFSSEMASSVLKELLLDTAVPRSSSQELAESVEQCTCPPGYTGLSCEVC